MVKPGGICHIEVPGLLNLEKWYNGDILEYLQNAHPVALHGGDT